MAQYLIKAHTTTKELITEKIYVELTTRPRSIMQLSRDLTLAPWKIFGAIHELEQVGRASYSAACGHWIITDF
jgi:hypothetical protein